MGKVFNAILGIGAVAGAAAAFFAWKKHKDAEEYDYEEFDEEDCGCCCGNDAESSSDESIANSEDTEEKAAAVEKTEEAEDSVEETLDKMDEAADSAE